MEVFLLISKIAKCSRHVYLESCGFSMLDATLWRERNHCGQPLAFPSSMRKNVIPSSNDITSSCFAGNIRDLRRDDNKVTTLPVHRTFFCIFFFLPFLHDYNVKISNFAFYGERKKNRRKFISPSELVCGP